MKNISSATTSELHRNGMEPLFSPPLHQQRHQFVVDFIQRNNTKKVVDLGCCDCTLLHRLKFHHEIELLSGVDINGQVIRKKMRRLAPLPADYLQPGDRPLTIELFQGSVTQKDSRLRGFDLVTSIELIEHLQLADVELFSEVVFGFMAPVSVIVTTPNSEFNPLLPGLVGFRHLDHKFEWTRAEFQTWALKVCEEYGYEVYFTGVGQAPPGQQASAFGFCSQIGVFQRLSTTEHARVMPSSDVDEVFSYTLLYNVAYPSLRDNNILQGVVVNEVMYWTERLRRERMEERTREGDEASQVQAGRHDGSVPLVQLWSCCPKVKDLCGTLSHFRQLLLDHPLVTLTQDASAVMVNEQHQDQEDGEYEELEDTGCTETRQYSLSAIEEDDWESEL